MIGDYKYDIEAGRQAGTSTVLFTGSRAQRLEVDADYFLESFAEPAGFWAWAESQG
jgi:phosphoglycolate phosphatase-like HAD superfamily hydrolase